MTLSEKYEQTNFFELWQFFSPKRMVRGYKFEETVDEKYYCSKTFENQLRSVVGDDLSRLNGCRLIDYRGGQSLHSWELGTKGHCTPQEIKFMNLLIQNRRKPIFWETAGRKEA